MGIRPFVAIRQDLSESAPNILESQMNGILVGPAVQDELKFTETINISADYGDINTLLARAATEVVTLSVVGLHSGADTDFSKLNFGGKSVVATIDTQSTYEASIKTNAEKHVLKIDLSADDGADGKVTTMKLLEKGAEVGDMLQLSFNNGTGDIVEEIKIRSFDVVDNMGTNELYITLWSEIADTGITDATVITLIEKKTIPEVKLSILDPMTVIGDMNSGESYTLDNTMNPIDGGFSATLFVYMPLTSATGPSFSNRIISTERVMTLSNFEQKENVYKVTNGILYNFFSANRVDLANNIFEVTTEDYVEKLGYPTVNNKLSYAMMLISAEVPGAKMKVYVTANDEPASYIDALGKLATSDTVYSVSVLTDNDSVLNSVVGMVKTAGVDTVAKWKMGVICPRVPHYDQKLSTDTYVVTRIALTDSYYIETTVDGFLAAGIEGGDYLFGSVALGKADMEYYDHTSEPYTTAAYAIVDSVATDNKLIVTVISPGFDLASGTNGQDLILAKMNKYDDIRIAIKAQVESISNHGIVSMFPDKYEFTVNSEQTLLPGFYAAAVLNSAMAHLPPQQGLSNMSFNSIDRVIGSSFQYTDGELDEIASSGVLVVLQESFSSRPYILRQLTTDMKSLESMEINKVRCLDYATLGFASVLEDFVGKRNVTEENVLAISRLLDQAGSTMIRSTKNAFLGSVITTYDIVDVYVPSGEKDGITAIIDVETPTSLNKIRLFVSSGIDKTDEENN